MKQTLISAVTILSVFGAAAGEPVRISPEELENLGVETVNPMPATDVAVIGGTARVAIPPMREAIVASPQPGLLTSLYVSPGDSVSRGQKLADLQSPEFLTLQREFLDAVSAYQLAESELNRDRQLHAEGIISARRLEESVTRSAIAAAGLEEHRQLLRISGLVGTEIETLQSGTRLLESLTLRAPLDGVIIERLATAGQRLDSMSPIYRLADLSELWLEIAVPHEQAAGIRVGMFVQGGGGSFRAEVFSVGRAIDVTTQSITARARIVQGVDTLSPGQLVPVEFVTDAAGAPVWKMPSSAVTRSGQRNYLFILGEAGFEAHVVAVIAVSEGRTYVRADLQPSDRIAISGISALKALWTAEQEARSE